MKTVVRRANSQNVLFTVCFDFLVYQCGGNGCGKAVVDIDGGNARSAAIEHCQKRREPFEGRAVTNAGRHGDNRATEKAAHDAGQGSFHAGDHNDDVGILELRHVLEQPVKAGNTDIADQLGPLAHDLGGDLRLERHRQIGCSGSDYRQDHFGCRQLLLFEGDRSRQLLVFGVGELARFFQGVENIRLGPGRQDVVAFGRQALEYLDYVLGGLAWAEDDLRETPPDLTMMVDTRKAKVLERQMPEFLDRLVDTNFAALDLL